MNEQPRIFVHSDTHGHNKELNEVLKLARFDFNRDTLIHIGDCVDRGPDSYNVIETLLKIKNLIAIQGNHDYYLLNFIETGYHPWEHGSHKTAMSYAKNSDDSHNITFVQKMSGVSTNFNRSHIPESHKKFFRTQLPYYVDKTNRLFVHGGYEPMEPIETQSEQNLTWDRDLVEKLYMLQSANIGNKLENYPDVNNFKRVFVGHTPTNYLQKGCVKPMYLAQLVDIDTGRCFGGKLTLIDITDDNNHVLYQNL